MDQRGRWSGAGVDALSWIQQVASDLHTAGYGVGPMPDNVWVLHPLAERLDGKPMDEGYEPVTVELDGCAVEVEDPDAVDPPVRVVRWHEYVRRRGIPMFVPPGHPSLRDALPGVWEDDFVEPPDEGSIYDSITQRALFDVLLRHSAGPDAIGTAYYYDFWVGGSSRSAKQLPNVLRGPLVAWEELFDRPDYVLNPQNIWPDDHSWVMGTHVDSWATEISGSTELVEEIIASPDLEAIRLPHLN